VTRMLDLGIEPYLVASSVIGVMAQRLVRRVCPDCGTGQTLDASQVQQLNLPPEVEPPEEVSFGSGCERCRHTGYRGRTGLFELLEVDETIQDGIQQRLPARQLKSQARQSGMRTLQQEGIDRIKQGQTSLEEVLRVTLRAGG